MDPRRQSSAKRVLPDGADQSPQTRRRTTEPEERGVLQATKALQGMSMVATSPATGYYPNHPSLPAPSYGGFPYVQPGEYLYQGQPLFGSASGILPERSLSLADLKTLWDAAGKSARPDFGQIKQALFQNRGDLSPEVLEDACWTQEEDVALMESGITLYSSPGELENVAEHFSNLNHVYGRNIIRLKSSSDCRTRFRYLNSGDTKEIPGGPSAGAQRSRAYLPPPAPRRTGPGYSAPPGAGAYPSGAGRGPGGAGFQPQRIPGGLTPMQGPPSDLARQARQHHDSPRMAPQTSQGSFWDAYRTPAPQDYLDDDPRGYVSSRPGASPGVILDDRRSRSNRPRASPVPPIVGPPGGSRQPSDSAVRNKASPSGISEEMVEDIRIKAAQGVPLREIQRQEQYRHASRITFTTALRKSGYKPWTREEDSQLMALQRQQKYKGNWAKICKSRQLRRGRSQGEVEARCGYLAGPKPEPEEKKQTDLQGPGSCRFTPEDDRYIMLALAQRHPTLKTVREKRFPHLKPNILHDHATKIGARWGTQEDALLRAEVERVPSGTAVPWDTIAAKYHPPRMLQVVKRRWEYLTTSKVRLSDYELLKQD